jgi:hypothetical protein
MVVADSLFEYASTCFICFETLDFPLRAGREMRIAEKVLVFQNIGPNGCTYHM